MSRLDKQQQSALELVARRFSATWDVGDGDPPNAWLTLGGTRIAVESTTIENPDPWTKPRLRFDKVALGLVRRLRAGLADAVPDGETVMLTCTAPIRLPAQTVAVLAGRVRDALAHRSAPIDMQTDLCGNQVRARLVKGVGARMPKVVGFVHNPESDPGALLDLTSSMLQHIGAAADRPVPERFAGDRWLVLTTEGGPVQIQTHRQIYAQLSAEVGFEAAVMLFANGRVESLSG
jgi:hypothetical protein